MDGTTPGESGEGKRKYRRTASQPISPEELEVLQKTGKQAGKVVGKAAGMLFEKAKEAGEAHERSVDAHQERHAKLRAEKQRIDNEIKRGMNLGRRGEWIDGWSDLLEDMAHIQTDVRKQVLGELKAKELPDVKVDVFIVRPRFFSLKTRPYIIMRTAPGATTAIYISARGSDLYVSWKTFIRGVLDLNFLILLFLVSSFPTICVGATSLIGAVVENIITLGGGNTTLGAVLFATLFWTILIFLFLCTLVALAGNWLHGDILWYFLVDPDIFAVDDVTVMSHAADKTLRSALRKTGVSEALLRRKTDFKGNRAGTSV